MTKVISYFLLLFLIISSCDLSSSEQSEADGIKLELINESGTTVQTRFNPPEGYVREKTSTNSFANYLQNLPLKPVGSKVKYYDGQLKLKDVYAAVVDMEIQIKIYNNVPMQFCA